MRPAMLNSLSQAAEAGSALLNLRDSWHTAGKDLSTSTGVSWTPQVRIQLLGSFKRAGLLQGGKVVLFLR